MTEMVTLALPFGAESAPVSHGVTSYAPYREDHTDPASRWLVEVPRETVDYFTGVGGFIMKSRPAPEAHADTFVRMFHPDHGVNDDYEVEDGFHLVPNGPEVDAMRSHGFKVEGEEGEPEPVPEMVPAEDHRQALSRIASLEETIGEHRRDAKAMRDKLDAAEGRVAELEGLLDEATATKPKP